MCDDRLKDIGGDWHELESKALRRERERKERERARAAQSQQAQSQSQSQPRGDAAADARDRDRKRPNEGGDHALREAKRPHVDPGNARPQRPPGQEGK